VLDGARRPVLDGAERRGTGGAGGDAGVAGRAGGAGRCGAASGPKNTDTKFVNLRARGRDLQSLEKYKVSLEHLQPFCK